MLKLKVINKKFQKLSFTGHCMYTLVKHAAFSIALEYDDCTLQEARYLVSTASNNLCIKRVIIR